MAQAVSRVPATGQALVQTQDNICDICGEESGTGTLLLTVLCPSPVSTISHSFIPPAPSLYYLFYWQYR